MQIRVIDAAGKPIPQAFIQTSIWTEEKNFLRESELQMRFAGRHHDRFAKNFVDSADSDFKARLCWRVPEFPDQYARPRVEDPGRICRPSLQRSEPSRHREERKGEPVQGARIEWEWPANELVQSDAPGALAGRRRAAWQQIRGESDSPGLRRQRSRRRMEQPKGHCSGGNHRSAGNHPALRDSRPGEGDRSFGQAGSRWRRDLGRQSVFSGADTAALTDAKGFCSLPAFPDGPMRISVVLKDWMPDSREVNIAPNMRPVDFQLRPGRKLRIRFVDRAGAPLPGVFVSIERWRGVRNLASNVNGVVKFKIPNTSDEQGIFEWDWAARRCRQLRLRHRGFRGHGAGADRRRPGARRHLQPRVAHFGTLYATRSRGAISKSSSLCPSSIFGPIFRSLDRRQSRQGKAGTFAMAFDRTDIEHGVQIEAPGYKTYRTSDAIPSAARIASSTSDYGPRRITPDGSSAPTVGPFKESALPFRRRLEQLDGDIFNERAFNKPKKDEDDDNDDSNKRGTSGRNGAFEIASQLEPYVLVIVTRGRLRRSQSAGGPASGRDSPPALGVAHWAARAVGKASRRLRHRSPPHSSDGRG